MSSGETEQRKLDLTAVTEAPAWDRVASSYAGFVADHLGSYARDAIELAGVDERDQVLDVATGPGTLALQAARTTRVHALDFSEQMLQELRDRATEDELANLVLTQGDGQALPHDDGSFDVVFSMFGLFMFPDRAKGFAELARVLRPRGRAVVASWQPQDDIVAFSTISAELAKETGMADSGEQPLAEAAVLKAEMSAAGFEVTVHPTVHVWSSPSLDTLWEGLKRAHVALGVAREQLSSRRFDDLLRRTRARLEDELGTGPQEIEMPAWLALGHRR